MKPHTQKNSRSRSKISVDMDGCDTARQGWDCAVDGGCHVQSEECIATDAGPVLQDPGAIPLV